MQENISRLHYLKTYLNIPMKNSQLMKLFHAIDNLYKQFPYHGLIHELVVLLTLFNFVAEIFIIGELHDYTGFDKIDTIRIWLISR